MFKPGGEAIEIERGERQQIQVDEKRTAGRVLDVGVPVAQARWVSIALTALVASCIWLIVAWGPTVFAGVVFVFGTTTFIWFLLQASRWEYGVTILEIANGTLLTLGCAGVGWSLWKVASRLVPTMALPDWLAWLPLVSRWASLLSVVFSLSLFVHLELAFIQELAQRSPFQEKAVWGAVGKALETWLQRPRDGYREPIIVRGGNGNQQRPPLSERIAQAETGDDVTPEVREAADLAEFVVIGHKELGFSRRAWRNVELSSGTVVTENQARAWTRMLKDARLAVTRNNETVLAVSVREALAAIAAPN